MAKHQVLFCPFCRESFEDRSVCPEHEIPLVPLEKLPKDLLDPEAQRAPVEDDSTLSVWEPSYGRAWVAAAALLNALAIVLELVQGVQGSRGLLTFELAVMAPSLWTLLIVSFTLLYVLKRRRTPRALRGLRVLVPALGFVSPLTIAWVFYRLHRGAPVWATGGRTIGLDVGMAAYVVGGASLLMVIGGLRLGVLEHSDG